MPLFQFLAQLATLVAACVAVYGITKWRNEHRGAKQIDLAEEALELFYRAQDALKYIRNPGSFSSETEDVVKGENESEKEYRARKNAYIIFGRFKNEQETFSRIHALRYRFMAVFGKEATKPFDEMNDIAWEIKKSALRLARLWARDYHHSPEEMEKHRLEVEKYESIFWTGLEQDPLAPRIEACINSIETTCRHIIEYGANKASSRARDA